MNGAEALLLALEDSGIEVCFANPGTSEMHLVAAMGKSNAIRPVLCLFEGVASAAADGYARMSGQPATTLLHLGPGYANSMANLHNARRAGSAIVNIVGEHATDHLQYDAPLTSDIQAHARLQSHWVETSDSADDLAKCGRQACVAAREGNGRIATLIVPADHAWNTTVETGDPVSPAPPEPVSSSNLEQATEMLRNGKQTGLVLGGSALHEDALYLAGQIAKHTGAQLYFNTSPTRLQRGAGRVAAQRIPYLGDQARAMLRHLEQVILIGAYAPVAFFAYPGQPGITTAPGCTIFNLAEKHLDLHQTLALLCEFTGANSAEPTLQPRAPLPPEPDGAPLTLEAIGASLAELMPEDAIISDESVTSGRAVFPATQGARPHDWLTLTGGAIGQGLPLSLGAAIACPERKVIALQADGSAMYTVQALWTIAREQADVTVIIFNNSEYAILNGELERVGAGAVTDKAQTMLDLSRPNLRWTEIATGMGMLGIRVETKIAFHDALKLAMTNRVPTLIEAVLA